MKTCKPWPWPNAQEVIPIDAETVELSPKEFLEAVGQYVLRRRGVMDARRVTAQTLMESSGPKVRLSYWRQS